MPQQIAQSSNISANFEFAKTASILLVATGHFFEGSILWIPVSIALFVFAFSSSYFTALKYVGDVDIRAFWKKKIARLGPNLLIINLVLLGIFMLQGRDNILSWQTPIAMLGLSGFFDWFNIKNHSPFGAGLWFFTLLLLFYCLYPYISRLTFDKKSSLIFGVATFVSLATLHHIVPMSHMLWFTIFGFCYGIVVVRTNSTIPASISGSAAILLAIAMVVVNKVYAINAFNYFFLVAISMATVHWLLVGKLPHRLKSLLKPWSGCVLEIYFLHMALFVRMFDSAIANYAASMALILILAPAVNKGVVVFDKMLMDKTKRAHN